MNEQKPPPLPETVLYWDRLNNKKRFTMFQKLVKDNGDLANLAQRQHNALTAISTLVAAESEKSFPSGLTPWHRRALLEKILALTKGQ